jgi:AAA15 family ATPase/GTPase
MADKIESVKIENFGPISSLNWQNIGSINLVIGANGCGKTFLLKALYSAIKTLELYKRGNDTTDISRVLRDKLYWTFQAENIGSLVSKGKEHLHMRCVLMSASSLMNLGRMPLTLFLL